MDQGSATQLLGKSDPVAAARAVLPEIAARAGRHDRDGTFPHDSIADLRRAGLLALPIERADGGAGAGLATSCEVVGVIGQGCAATALVLAMQCLQLQELHRGGWTPAIAGLVVRDVIGRGALVNALRVEPALGTPARGGLPATVACRTAQGWALSGHKTTATGIPGLSYLLVWARTSDTPPRTGAFLVEASAAGIEVVPTWDQLGLRASGSHDVIFHDVAVPADHAGELRVPEAWGTPPPDRAAWAALLVAALYTGVARAARDWFADFLRTRTPANLGAPLATLPRMQDGMGEIQGLLVANDRMIRSVAADVDAGAPPAAWESAMVKAIAAENAIAAVERAVALSGNPGLSRAHPLERHLRDVLCARIHTPQLDAAHVAAGRAALGV